ncbi:MAG: redoxin family protein [Tepidisphaeraceae bacterium]
MKKRFGVLAMVAAMAVSGLAGAAFAADDALKVGDPAPALAGGKWLKGEPVEKFEAGKIYVVEFWATWCGPCKEAIPHITEMAKTYAKDGVTFIGQDVWEHDQAKAEPFVKQMGDKMDYHVRMDSVPEGAESSDGVMAQTWMVAAGRNGIPCTFLIGKDGKIAWIGHPMQLEPVLKEVIAGTFDAKKSAADSAAKESKASAISKALAKKDYDGALAAAEALQKDGTISAAQLASLQFSVNMQKKDYAAVRTAAQAVIDAHKAPSQTLSVMAIKLAMLKNKDNNDTANKLAAEAVKMTNGKDGQALFIQSAVFTIQGETEKAAAAKKASLDATPEEGKQQLLARYDALLKSLDKPTTKPAAAAAAAAS